MPLHYGDTVCGTVFVSNWFSSYCENIDSASVLLYLLKLMIINIMCGKLCFTHSGAEKEVNMRFLCCIGSWVVMKSHSGVGELLPIVGS